MLSFGPANAVLMKYEFEYMRGSMVMTEQVEKMLIVDMIVRERIARDRGHWDEMASYWHPESTVEVSWFQGSGSQFIEQSKKNIRPDSINFHQLSPATVTLNGARAIVDMPCVLQNFSELDGIDVNQAGHAHLLWRAVRSTGDQWLIAGLRAYYVRDSLIACNPGQVLTLDGAKLAGYRLSYRYLSYVLDFLGNAVRDDLPGIDRPETVETLYASERQWLSA
jgi:SnoaL-like domain